MSWWTLLYIAFGIVALWLLGEVLLQYKARLRWRLLAFAGFLGVVVGALIPSVYVIVVGTIAFGVGQTYVTLSFRRGFSTGWALGGSPGVSRRRKVGPAAADAGPTLEVTDLAYEPEGAAPGGPLDEPPAESAAEATAVYAPQPLPDDTGQYGVYAASAPTGQEQGYDQREHDQTGYQPQDYGQGAGAYTGPYDYGTGETQQSYAAYSDPYIGTATGAAAGQDGYGAYEQPGAYGAGYGSGGYGTYDAGYGAPQQYPGEPGTDPYAGQYGMDTPPGGVWVPHQRDGDQQMPPPPQEPPSPYGYDPHPNDQQHYRY
ncbi:hypothetical protein [Streptomyces sp. NPDC047928]|uniref:hypothetical protein n=1 Tax=unclassified Streptomyces TaxID=2593676 RepID=UPI00371F28A0